MVLICVCVCVCTCACVCVFVCVNTSHCELTLLLEGYSPSSQGDQGEQGT